MLSLAALAVTGASGLAACGGDGERAADPVAPGQLGLVSSDRARAPGDPEAADELAGALRAAGARLYGAAAATTDGTTNLALSPYSVLVTLALLLNGAAGRTQEQLLALFGDLDVATVNGGLNALTQQVEAEAGPVTTSDGVATEVALDAANALFGQVGLRFGEPFLDTLAEQYGAGLRTVDYVTDTEAARTAVNDWTAEQTRDKIPAILAEGDVTDLTRLVLVNTLYLKAPWDTPFEERLTAPAPFILLDGSEVEVDQMRSGIRTAPAAVGEGWQAAQLGYAGGGLAMTVVLPDDGRFAEVEAALLGSETDDGLGSLLDALRPTMLTVRLPRWTFRTQLPLAGPLADLGVVDAFDPGRADLSGITDEEDLHVTAVAHEVFIAVDEEGTEAAAATAAVAGATSVPVVELDLVVDRPYLFVVHDVALGAPLFVGRVTDPRS